MTAKFVGTGPPDVRVLREALAAAKRELVTLRLRVTRRQEDRQKLAELATRFAAVTNPTELEAIRLATATLDRRLQQSILLDGDDTAVQTRLRESEQRVNERESQLEEQRTARMAPEGPIPDSRQIPTKVIDRRRIERIDNDITEILVELDSLEAILARLDVLIERKPVSIEDPAGTPLERLVQTLTAARARADAAVIAVNKAKQVWQLHVAANQQVHDYFSQVITTSAKEGIEQLGLHLEMELDGAAAQVQRHWERTWPQIVAFIDHSTIKRINTTESRPDTDPAYDQLYFRSSDLDRVSAAMRLAMWPMLATVSKLLPERSRLAFASARIRFPDLLSPTLPRFASELSETQEFLFSSLPKTVTGKLVQNASLLEVGKALGNIAVPPSTRWRRGERLVAAALFCKEVIRTPALLIAPLSGLAIIGVSVTRTIRGTHVAVGMTFLVLSVFVAHYTFARSARLAERIILERGRSQLRDLIAKRGAETWEIWRGHFMSYGRQSIARALEILKERSDSATEHLVSTAERKRERAGSRLSELATTRRKADGCLESLRKIIDKRLPDLERVAVQLREAGAEGQRS